MIATKDASSRNATYCYFNSGAYSIMLNLVYVLNLFAQYQMIYSVLEIGVIEEITASISTRQ